MSQQSALVILPKGLYHNIRQKSDTVGKIRDGTISISKKPSEIAQK